MSATQQSTTSTEPAPVRAKPAPSPQPKPKRQPPYAVILHNDDLNGFDWVVGVVLRVIRCSRPRAFWLVLKTHVGGRGLIFTGSMEVAEFKAEQIRLAGPDPRKVYAGARLLKVSIEPLPQ